MNNIQNRIKVYMGNIITLRVVKDDKESDLHVDAIVNPANNELLPGGGLSGAIHKAAGPQLELECQALHGCKTGEAKLTKGYSLPVKHIIHTVGPIWEGGNNNEQELLARSYTSSLEVAVEHKIKSIAFPSISTGNFNYPVTEAARTAIKTVTAFLSFHPEITNIYFIMTWDNFFIYDGALAESIHS